MLRGLLEITLLFLIQDLRPTDHRSKLFDHKAEGSYEHCLWCLVQMRSNQSCLGLKIDNSLRTMVWGARSDRSSLGRKTESSFGLIGSDRSSFGSTDSDLSSFGCKLEQGFHCVEGLDSTDALLGSTDRNELTFFWSKLSSDLSCNMHTS